MAERSRHISGEARVAQLRRELDRCSDPDKARPKRNELRRLRATSLGSSISVKLQLAARRGREGARHDRHSAPRFCLLEILATGCANVLKEEAPRRELTGLLPNSSGPPSFWGCTSVPHCFNPGWRPLFHAEDVTSRAIGYVIFYRAGEVLFQGVSQ